jgi:hypothetical protein
MGVSYSGKEGKRGTVKKRKWKRICNFKKREKVTKRLRLREGEKKKK